MEQFEPTPENKEAGEKQALWYKTMEQLDQVADRLGKRIDAGIKETVAAFAVNKFPTNGSCEGHVEERFGKKVKLRPYIDIGFREPKQRFVGESEIKERIAAEYGITAEEVEDNDAADKAYWEYTHKQDVPETPEFMEILAKNKELERSFQQALEAFYQNRQVGKDTKLIVKPIGPIRRLYITTAKENPKSVAESELEQYRQELSAEQEEVRALTQFLKERFFNQTS